MKKLILICLVTLCAGRIYAQNWQNVQAPWGQNCPVFIPNGYQFQGFINQNDGYYANYLYNNQQYQQPVLLSQNRGTAIAQFFLNFAQAIVTQINYNNSGYYNQYPNYYNNQQNGCYNQNYNQSRIYYYRDATGRLCWRYY